MLRLVSLVTLLVMAPLAARAELVHISSGNDKPLLVVFARDSAQPVQHCAGSCTLDLHPGRYRLMSPQTPSEYLIDETIVIDGPTNIRVRRGNRTAHRALTGLAWTFTSTSIPLGLLAGYYEWSSHGEGDKPYVGALTILFGASVVLAATCFATATTTASSVSVQREPRRFVLVPGLGGVAATITF